MEDVYNNTDLFYGILPVFLGTQALYWVTYLVCPYVFSSFWNKLDVGKQSYWAASFVSCTLSTIIAVKTMQIGFPRGMYMYFSYDHYWADERARDLCYMICGYFFSDLAIGVYYHDKWPGHIANYIHHTAGIFAFAHLAKWNMGHGIALSTFMLESTNVFNNLRWFLDTAGMKESHSTLYLGNGIVFTVSFFVIRVVAFTMAGYHYMIVKGDQFWGQHWHYKALFLTTYFTCFSLQYFWFSKLAQGLYKILTKPKKAKKVE